VNPVVPSSRIDWPQATCQLFTGSLDELVRADQLSVALAETPTSQVILRDAAVPFGALEPVRGWLRQRAPVEEFEFPGGESAKTFDSCLSILELLATAGLDRGGLVIVAGGGALGDAAGFAASIWHRGVPWVAIPTTLLAMVDASVGGKTGVDLPQGKNLVGAFKQPALVAIDPSALHTLPEE